MSRTPAPATGRAVPASPAAPADAPSVGLLGRLAGLSFRRRRLTLVAWLLAVAAAIAGSAAWSGAFEADYTVRGSDSRAAQDLLSQRFPGQAGDTVDVVFRSTSGVAAARPQIASALEKLGAAAHVESVDDPF